MLKKVYSKTQTGILLVIGLVFISLQTAILMIGGSGPDWFQFAIVPVALLVYFIPGDIDGEGKFNDLKRKLLWLFLVASLLVFIFEVYKSLLRS